MFGTARCVVQRQHSLITVAVGQHLMRPGRLANAALGWNEVTCRNAGADAPVDVANLQML